MAKQVAVIGMGRFGSTLARTLYQAGHDVLVIDRDGDVIRGITGEVTYPVEGDATNEAFLRGVGILDYDVAVVAIGSHIQDSLLATVLLYSLREEELKKRRPRGERREEAERKPFLVARAQNELHANALARLGADKVVQIEREAGEELVHLVTMPYGIRKDVGDYMTVTSDFSITKLRAPQQTVNRTLRDIRLGRPRDKYGLMVIAVRRGKELILTPDEDETVLEGDVLIVGGRTELLEHLIETPEPVVREEMAERR